MLRLVVFYAFCLEVYNLFFQLPEWIHHLFHGFSSSENISPNVVPIISVMAIFLLCCYIVYFFLEQISREKPLKAKLGNLQKELDHAKNESQIIKREAEEAVKKAGLKSIPDQIQKQPPPGVAKEVLERVEKEKEALMVRYHGQLIITAFYAQSLLDIARYYLI